MKLDNKRDSDDIKRTRRSTLATLAAAGFLGTSTKTTRADHNPLEGGNGGDEDDGGAEDGGGGDESPDDGGEDGSDSPQGGDDDTIQLNIRVFDTPDVPEGMPHLENAVDELIEQYSSYSLTNWELEPNIVKADNTYFGYDEGDFGEETSAFRDYLENNNNIADGWINLLRVETEGIVPTNRASGTFGPTYNCGTSPVAIVNLANIRVERIINAVVGDVGLLELTYMHELAHTLGAKHKHGTQYRHSGSRANSVMLYIYATPLPVSGVPNTIKRTTGLQDPVTTDCDAETIEDFPDTKALSTKFTGCALKQIDNTLSNYYDTDSGESGQVLTCNPNCEMSEETIKAVGSDVDIPSSSSFTGQTYYFAINGIKNKNESGYTVKISDDGTIQSVSAGTPPGDAVLVSTDAQTLCAVSGSDNTQQALRTAYEADEIVVENLSIQQSLELIFANFFNDIL